MPYEPLYTLTNRMMNSVADIGQLVGQIAAFDKLSPNPQLRRISRMRSIHSSLAIEANTLTLEQVTAVLDGKRVLAPPKDVHEAQNAYEAYDALSTMNPYSLDDLLMAHKFMMDGLVRDAGCFRTGNVGVFDGERLVHAGTPARYVPEVMQDLFDWLKTTDIHPLVASCVFHYEFEFIHPFSDGNGRTGRLWHSLLLQNWQSAFAWLPVESLVAQHQQEYYDALGDSGAAGGDSTTFVEFMLDMIEKTLAEAVASQSNVGMNVGMNVGLTNEAVRNKERLLDLIGKNPTITMVQMADELKMSKRQIERLVAELKEQGKLARIGARRNGRWEVN